MIKNQLLNVTFDDMTSEKNKKKLLLQNLVVEKHSLKQQLLTSQRLIVISLSLTLIQSEENTNPESLTNLKFLYQNYVLVHEVKLKTMLAKQFRKKIYLFMADLMVK